MKFAKFYGILKHKWITQENADLLRVLFKKKKITFHLEDFSVQQIPEVKSKEAKDQINILTLPYS